MQRVVVHHDFTLPPARVFAHLAEHENLEPLLGARITRLNDGTDGTRNGVGSARSMKVGSLPAFVETVTEVVPDERIRYRITKGGPLRDHEGVMHLSPRPGGAGTHLRYEITFGGVLPGVDRVVAAMLRRSIPRGLAGVDAKA